MLPLLGNFTAFIALLICNLIPLVYLAYGDKSRINPVISHCEEM